MELVKEVNFNTLLELLFLFTLLQYLSLDCFRFCLFGWLLLVWGFVSIFGLF